MVAEDTGISFFGISIYTDDSLPYDHPGYLSYLAPMNFTEWTDKELIRNIKKAQEEATIASLCKKVISERDS